MLVNEIHTNISSYRKICVNKPPVYSDKRLYLSFLNETDEKRDSISFKGGNELRLAAAHGDLEAVKKELQNGTNVNACDDAGGTALMAAVLSNSEKIVEELLKRPDINVNIQNVIKETALMMAHNKNIYKMLLKCPNINVNLQDIYGKTALHRAVENDNSEFVEELLNHPDINPDIQNEHGEPALLLAYRGRKYKSLDAFIKSNATNLNVQDSNGVTLLMSLTSLGELSYIIKLLKDPDIDVNIQSKYGNTALMSAATSSWKKRTLEALLKHKNIDVNIQNSEGYTAIMLAAKHGNADALKKLLERDDIDLTLSSADGTVVDIAVAASGESMKKLFSDELMNKLKEKAKLQSEHPELIIKKTVKPSIDVAKLSPEENIWTKEEISSLFMNLVNKRRYSEAFQMLEITPFIDLEGANNKILIEVCGTKNPELAEKVFNYKCSQKELQKKYDEKRKTFLEDTIKKMGYNELKNNNIALNTTDGFKVLLASPEFNPNDIIDKSSLFERACNIDPEGDLANLILLKYGDVFTIRAAKTKNPKIKALIDKYEESGKYTIIMNNIERNAFMNGNVSLAAMQLQDLLKSECFQPKMTDSVGNTVLHIAASLPVDIGPKLIRMSIDKGIDINTGNMLGQTALMSAVKALVKSDEKDKSGRTNLLANIKFLLDNGTNIDAKDNNGKTALHFACMGTVVALLNLLISKNPNALLADNLGKCAGAYLEIPEMKKIYRNYVKG